LYDERGNFFGDICHIRAKSRKGPRYNRTLTYNQRRSYENLIILCKNDHNRIDNDKSFTVTKLKKMKKNHENKFMDKLFQISENLLEKLITAANKQYELLYGEIKEVKKDTTKILNILSKANLEKKPKKNVHTFTGNDFTISWPDSWTTNVPYILQKE